MRIYESAEDYLEAILVIRERRGMVRSIDIANAMKKLRESGYIEMDGDGCIHLLPDGERIAGSVYERHRTLTDLFVYLGVSQEVAAHDACKVEHDLSQETFEKIKEHVRRVMGNAAGGAAEN